MKVYRITKWQYLDDLSGTGARLYGGRWNQEGTTVLYTSAHLSLAVLELLANQVRSLVDDTYGYLTLEIPDDIEIPGLIASDIDKDWRSAQYSDQTVRIGTKWIQSKESLAMLVPSAVLCQEYNVLINPNHESFEHLIVQDKRRLNLDQRVGGQ